MNYLWAGMLLLGIVYGGFRGEMAAITEAALSSAKEAVSLCITLLGVMCFWVGMMNIAQKSGLLRTLAEKLDPLLNFLFPTLKKGDQGKRIYRDQCHRQYLWTWLGGNTGRTFCHAGIKEGQPAERGRGKPGNVYFSGTQYFFPATDPGQYDRLSQSVRIGKSIHDHGSCHSCDRDQHFGCRDLL